MALALTLLLGAQAASTDIGRSMLQAMHLSEPQSRYTRLEFADHTVIPASAATGEVIRLTVKVTNLEGQQRAYTLTRRILDASGDPGTSTRLREIKLGDGEVAEVDIAVRMPTRPGRTAVEINLQGRTEMLRAWFGVREKRSG